MSAPGRSGALVPVLAALGGGLLHAMSMADAWGGQAHWWLQLASLGVLAFVLDGASSARRGAALGWLFATAMLCGTFWWLFISMHTYGGLPSVLAALAVLALAAFLALYTAAAGAAFVRWKPAGLVPRIAMFASLWLGAELLRASWFTGFPWGASGYAHVDGPLAKLAPWIGVYGIGWLAAALAGSFAFVLRAPRVRVLPGEDVSPALSRGAASAQVMQRGGVMTVAGAILLGVLAAIPKWAGDTPPGKPLSLALLQGNIPQNEKFQRGSGIPFALNWYADNLRRAQASLVVAPETAIPLLPQHLGGFWEPLIADFAQGSRAAIVGIPLGSRDAGYTNSVMGLAPGLKQPYRYDKHHLVPFGEFIPPLFKWFTEMMNIPLGDFARGAVRQPSFEWQGERLAPNVCYEDLFGEDLAARFGDAATAPTMFVNVSNIAWFGNSVAIDQHLQISRMRALEFARPMVRATNTGATVVIDATGRVTHALERHTRGVLLATASGRSDITPYVAWLARFGLWPLWLLALGVPLALAMRSRVRR